MPRQLSATYIGYEYTIENDLLKMSIRLCSLTDFGCALWPEFAKKGIGFTITCNLTYFALDENLFFQKT